MTPREQTDWQALGLPDHSPFDILSRPRAVPMAVTAPKKRGPKPKRTMAERAIASLSDPGERKPSHFMVDIMSREESDRTLAIAGRGFA